MRGDRRALPGRCGPQPVAGRQAAPGALRSCRRGPRAEQGRAARPSGGSVALSRAAAGAKSRAHRQPRRGGDADPRAAQARGEARRRRAAGEGRRPAADRLVQGARPRHGGLDGQGARHHPHGHADQRQRRGGARRLCQPRRHPRHRVLPRGHAGSERQRDRAAGRDKAGWFDASTLKEPYRIEGKKTMGLELAEQLGWDVPDVILYPTGGGTGLIGMWKACAELEAIGFLGRKRPRMVAVQAAGCAPMVRAFEAGAEHAPRWENAHTIASGIRVPQAIGDFLILRAVRESGGFAIAVDDAAITAALEEAAREEGFLLCPEGAATYAAYKAALADGRIRRDERALLFNCATGLKYPLPPVHRTLDRTKPIDFAAL